MEQSSNLVLADDTATEASNLVGNERPLSTRMQLRECDPITDLLLALEPRSAKVGSMASAILANFRLDPLATYFYSRDKNHYADAAARRRYYPDYYAYSAVVQAVDLLSRCGLVEDIRTRPSPSATQRSRLRAKPRLRSIIATSPGCTIKIVKGELILIKTAGRSKRLIAYDDTDETLTMRAEVLAHNLFQGSFDVGLGDVPCPILSLAARQYHRVFIEDLSRGGRWYARWQNLRKELRPRITINGRATFEFDYRCCHPRLVFANAGLQLPFDEKAFDFYNLPGFDRAEVKAAIPILLNADSLRSAVCALALEFQKQGRTEHSARARAVCQLVMRTWPDMATFWCSGIGLHLQRVEGDICTAVQAAMRARGIPILSIHDGFIVPGDFAGLLDEVATSHMEDACRFLRENPIGSRADTDALSKATDPWRRRGRWWSWEEG